MGIKVNFAAIPDNTGSNFGPWPIREYPCVLKVDAYMTDLAGAPMTGPDGNQKKRETKKGDPTWRLKWVSLENEDRYIPDNLYFSAGGLKKVKILYTRAGLATGNEKNLEIEPEDLEDSRWWVIPCHEVRKASGVIDIGGKEQRALTETILRQYIRDGKIATTKYTFNAKGCTCNVCLACDGKDVIVDTRATFSGFREMSPEDSAKFGPRTVNPNGAGGTPTEDDEAEVDAALPVCGPCVQGNHAHKYKAKGCECTDQTHPDF